MIPIFSVDQSHRIVSKGTLNLASPFVSLSNGQGSNLNLLLTWIRVFQLEQCSANHVA